MRWAEFALIGMGLVASLIFGSSLLISRAYQYFGERWLELRRVESRITPPPMRTHAAAARLSNGSLLGRLQVERLGMSVMVREGTDARSLMLAAGHLAGTAMPGQDGNVVIAAHRDTFFRPLRDVRLADTITLETPGGKTRYLVEDTFLVKPDRTDLLGPTSERMLTLVTCYPFNYIGNAPLRFIVRARQIDP